MLGSRLEGSPDVHSDIARSELAGRFRDLVFNDLTCSRRNQIFLRKMLPTLRRALRCLAHNVPNGLHRKTGCLYKSPNPVGRDLIETSAAAEAEGEFVARDVPGIIIDVRSNPGGTDEFVPEMMGYFFSEPDFYEYQYFDNWLTRLSVLDFAVPLTIKPKEPHYGGPVAVLIDQYTVSSGEGFPLLAQRLPQGHVVGVYGTYGSFGMCCSHINLPGDLELLYASGQSQNADHQVLLEGDHNLQGGVAPDIRVPLTKENVYAMFVENEDVVLQYAM